MPADDGSNGATRCDGRGTSQRLIAAAVCGSRQMLRGSATWMVRPKRSTLPIVFTRNGTNPIVPTTVTRTPAQIAVVLDAVEQVAQNWNVTAGARILVVDWYGPHSPRKR